MRFSAGEHSSISRLGAGALIGAYLAAIVIANLTVAWFGPAVVIVNAFLLVSLDLTARDRLHQAWEGRHLAGKMGMLIATGSCLSYALAPHAGPIALASFVAFAAAGAVDALVYGALGGRGWLIRANGSNLVSALVDSAVFLSVLAAFGALPWALVPLLIAGQWGAKTIGGAVWSIILARRQPI
jgi:hypothetical protein